MNLFKLTTLFILIFLSLSFTSCEKEEYYGNTLIDGNSGILTDVEGKTYKIVKIGDQWWMAENLRTTKFNEGSEIQFITDNIDWASSESSAYCWYRNDQANSEKKIYGVLYNWHAVNTKKLSPLGWHVPTDSDWKQLEDFLVENGHHDQEGLVLKDTVGWENGYNGTNDYGFSALPGGFRSSNGYFERENVAGCWWSSSVATDDRAHMRSINTSPLLNKLDFSNKFGFSIRCIMD